MSVCHKQEQASKLELEAAFKENLSDQGNRTSIATTGRSPTKPLRALANGALHDQASLVKSPAGMQPVAQDSEGAFALKQMMLRKPFESKTQVEYYGLPPGVKVCYRSTAYSFAAVRRNHSMSVVICCRLISLHQQVPGSVLEHKRQNQG